MSEHEGDAPDIWPLHPSNVGTGLPLEGVRVLDLSRVLAGPLCAMVVADLGADVIKVEAPTGDPVRQLAPPRFGDDATYYLAVNRNRRNVVADLTDPADLARVTALARRADAVVENFLPSQAAQLHLDEIRAAAPGVVWVSIAAAAPGPLADEPAFDLLAQARSGIMAVTGGADQPMKVGAPVADVVAGLYGAVGLLAGLVARQSGRPGRHFEAPLLESAVTTLVNQAQGFLATGRVPRRLGNDHPSIAPYGPVRTSDGHLLLAVATDGQFSRLVDALDDDDLRAHAEFASNDWRVTERAALQRILDAIFATDTTDGWMARLAGTGVPCGPILDVDGALGQEQVRDGTLIQTVDLPAGPLRVLGTPLRVDGVRPTVRRAPRALGADDEELGFSR